MPYYYYFEFHTPISMGGERRVSASPISPVWAGSKLDPAKRGC